ncbi:MAG TPA: SAM-dependent chlorinase/fluorinase [Bacteroidota bacterium]
MRRLRYFHHRSNTVPAGRLKNRTGTPANQLIALLTDFGSGDHYVATVKGVILSVNPRARIVDLSHEVRPHNIREAGYLLWASYRYFPAGTVFVCIVDPGVGSDRRILCIETAKNTFIAPDNGLLDLVLLQEDVRSSYEILPSARMLTNPISATFHGRDIFAPVAAHRSMGTSAARFGKRAEIRKSAPLFYEPEKGTTKTFILHIDRFGNIVTNIPAKYFEQCSLEIGGTRVAKRIRTFVEAPAGQPSLIVGSSGLIEVVLKERSAAENLGASPGAPIKWISASG